MKITVTAAKKIEVDFGKVFRKADCHECLTTRLDRLKAKVIKSHVN